MNKIFGILGMFLLLSSIIIAVEVTNRQRDVSKEDFDTAELKGIDEYSRIDTFRNDFFSRELISRSDFNLPTSSSFKAYDLVCMSWNREINETEPIDRVCLDEVRVNKTRSDMVAELDKWEDSQMDLILQNIRKREAVESVGDIEESEVVLRGTNR
ncbi:MAG: hypothetical protein IH845_04765 [Nanoarchaeota archaeon]|nr:hypothetical protein [Nanoarchaeota archaeon]